MLLLPSNVPLAAGNKIWNLGNQHMFSGEWWEAKCIFYPSGGSVYQRIALFNAHEYFAAGWSTSLSKSWWSSPIPAKIIWQKYAPFLLWKDRAFEIFQKSYRFLTLELNSTNGSSSQATQGNFCPLIHANIWILQLWALNLLQGENQYSRIYHGGSSKRKR